MSPIGSDIPSDIPTAPVPIARRLSAWRKRWERVRDGVRFRGVAGFLWRALVRCVAPFGKLQLASLYAIDLDRPIEPVRAKVAVTMERACVADIDQLAPLASWSEDAEGSRLPGFALSVAERLNRGDICFVARVGSSIVHCNWIAYGHAESLAGRHIVLADDEAFFGGAYTSRDWRGFAIYTEANAAALRFLREQGCRRVYCSVSFENRPSRRTMHRVGWKRTGVLLAFTARGRKRAHIVRLRGRLEPFVEDPVGD